MNADRREKIAEWMKDLTPETKNKLKLAKRKLAGGTWYYIKEPLKGHNRHKWISLGTQDKHTANRIFTEVSSKMEYGDTECGTMIHMHIAKLDRDTRERTWQDVHDSFVRDGLAERTKRTYRSAWNAGTGFDPIRNQPLVGTTNSQLLEMYGKLAGGKQRYLLNLYTHAQSMGWLVSPNLVSDKEWKKRRIICGGNTASLAEDDHYEVLAYMDNALANWNPKGNAIVDGKIDKATHWMRRADKAVHQELYYFLEILWEIGTSNEDARKLTVDNVNWDSADENAPNGHIVFRRQKWSKEGGKDKLRQAIYFPISDKLAEVIRPLYLKAQTRPEGKQYLLPKMACQTSFNVKRTWEQYMKRAGRKLTRKGDDGVERKLTIHSYRYRMAEYLYEIGVDEREAQMLMGHNSREIQWAYAKANKLKVKALDVRLREQEASKIIKLKPTKRIKAA